MAVIKFFNMEAVTMTKRQLIILIEDKLQDSTVNEELCRLIDEVLSMTFDYNLDKLFGGHQYKKEFSKEIRKALRKILLLLGITRNEIKDFSLLYDSLKHHYLKVNKSAG